jgi:hypothetical protein
MSGGDYAAAALMYIGIDTCTLRTYSALDQAIQGEVVEVTYKGSKLRLVPTQNTSNWRVRCAAQRCLWISNRSSDPTRS